MERKTRNAHEQPEGRGRGWGAGAIVSGLEALPTRSPSRTFSSLWPTYMLMSSGPFTLRERMWEATLVRHPNAIGSIHPASLQAPWSPEEGKAALSGHCLGQEGLAGARGPVEQEARAPQAQAQQLRVL